MIANAHRRESGCRAGEPTRFCLAAAALLFMTAPGAQAGPALARGDETAAQQLGEDYVRYMLEVVAFYERQAQAILARPLPHVLLIHANALNAEWLDVLLGRLEGIGYRWIPLEQALEDSAYGRSTSGYTGAGGISCLHRWAITEGVDPAVFRGEPHVPDWVQAGRTTER